MYTCMDVCMYLCTYCTYACTDVHAYIHGFLPQLYTFAYIHWKHSCFLIFAYKTVHLCGFCTVSLSFSVNSVLHTLVLEVICENRVSFSLTQ